MSKPARALRLDSLDAVLAQARRLREEGYQRHGNWSLGQACFHLALMMEMSLDGFDFAVAWPVRAVGRLARPWALRWGFPRGIPLPGGAAVLRPPSEVADEEGVDRLERATARFVKSEGELHASPVLGEMDKAQWTRFHCRHAELHLGFLGPRGG